MGAPHKFPSKRAPLKTDTAYLCHNQKDATLTWIGHSSFLLQIHGLNILMDPAFSDRISPVSFAGPKRVVPLPFPVKDLPPIDVVLVTHNHYDHLDLPTLRTLYKQGQGRSRFFSPPWA